MRQWRRRPVRSNGGARAALSLLAALGLAAGVRADVPFPTCAAAGCSDPADFGSYLFIQPGALPDDYNPASGEAWKYAPDSGMDIIGVWERTTGRPDVVIAVLDSGIRWNSPDLGRKVALNPGELPVPEGCASQDCNGDGFVSVDDFAAACAADPNKNGFCDGQDLIRFYSNGRDDDGNGYVDDIAGWDFLEDDNDPDDDVDYGHGTGEAGDEVAEANNGNGFPGFAPSSLFLPLRVGDSFVAIDQEFAQAVVYAVDRRVAVISEALGTVSHSPSGQAAVNYAYAQGIPIIASAADEESRHHNYPAAYDHMIWVNSVRDGDGTFLDRDANGFDVLNGCTNYGGKAWVAIPSASCSSEATSRTGGLVALLLSHARNLIDAGRFSPHPRTGTPLSAEEVRQLLRASARDVDHSGDPGIVSTSEGLIVGLLLSARDLGLLFGSSRYPTGPGWDQFTGYGRPDGRALLDLVSDDRIPPEVDLSGGLRWFDTLEPGPVEVTGSIRADRARNHFDWTLDVGCGASPESYVEIGSGSAHGPLTGAALASWDTAATAARCGFDPAVPIESPDAHTVTIRLRATDENGNLGEDRRTVAIHHDATLHFAPRVLDGSGEASPVLVDLDGDGVLDIVHGGGDGGIRAIDGATGRDLPGFPVYTDPIPVHASPAYASGAVPVPHEGIVGAAAAADDLDGDGRPEIVVGGIRGGLYVFEARGERRPGFPVHTDPAFSQPANRDRLNDSQPGIVGGPTLVDLDGPDAEPGLEIVYSSLDGHLYAWRADGTPVAGFPVRLADPARVAIDPATGRATPLPGFDVRDRAVKSLSSPAVGDLDGDGRPEIVVATNEEYGGETNLFAIESPLLQQLALLLGMADIEDFSVDTGGRVYAVQHDGNAHPGGPFVPGWPVAVPLLTPGVLPTVGTGTPGSPALADLDGDGRLAVAIFGAVGPVLLLDGNGAPRLGSLGGVPRALAVDFAGGGFPMVPPLAGSPDAPFFAAIGAGAFGDLDGDGLPEYVAPGAGLRKLLDIVVPAQQDLVPEPGAAAQEGLAHNQLIAWNPRTGALLDAFPRVMDDLQFLSSPAVVDVDGDGVPEVVNGSGGYLVRAYRADGSTPDGWPKFTHGWHIGSPTPGDVDGDGLIEIVAISREGVLYVWDTPAPATEAAIPWAGFGADRRNTQNLSSRVPRTAEPASPLAALAHELESIASELDALAGTLPPGRARATRAARTLIDQALAALEAGDVVQAAAKLPGIAEALEPRRLEELAPLRERFVSAVRDTLERLLAAAPSCDDTRCRRRVARAERSVGDDNLALWARGIAQLSP
jgi:Subtilase family/FG-GAP-like repeat/FG-GAP repeat